MLKINYFHTNYVGHARKKNKFYKLIFIIQLQFNDFTITN